MSVDSIGELLRKFLIADTTVGGLVGSDATTAFVHALRLPQRPTLPAVVYKRISGVRIASLRGPASAAKPRYQVDAWANNVRGAQELGAAIRRRLEGYVGTWSDGGSPATTLFVQVEFVDDREFFEEEISGGLCRHSADYFIFHGTAAGTV